MIKRLLAFALVLASMQAHARDDERLQFTPYQRARVYTIYAAIGKASMIQLQEGETVDPKKSDASVVGLGFGSAWTLGVRENNFVIKPKMAFPDTNMILVTNKRTYAFDLKMAPKYIQPTYILAFSYPEDEKKAQLDAQANLARVAAQAAQAQADKDRLTESSRAQRVVVNTEYFWRGDNTALKPTAAWDDGRFTHLQYDHAGELPVFFKVLPDGTEALVNSNIDPAEKSVVILQEVLKTIRVRLGQSVVEVVNHGFKTPAFNTTGMSEHGAVRVERSGARYE